MSNLLKSKFLLGVMTLAVMLGGVVAVNATQAAAANCTITTTLRVGSRGAEVKCLQAALDNGLVGDGVFGPKTKAKVVAFQSAHGLVADGIFGAKSRAALVANGGVSGNFPAGCQSASGYSSTTGAPCNSGPSMGYPAGCSSSSGYSVTTGQSCSGGNTSQTGPVTASLSSDNPASAYIIGGQATADLAHFTFTGSGTVNTVVLNRTGVSDQNTLSNVYLYDGVTRLTDGFSFNNAGQLTMNSLGIMVNGSKTISVKADVASVTNASSLGITLTSFTIAGGTPVNVNVRGNEMTYGVGNLATAYLGTQTVSPGCTTTCPTVNAGTSAYTVWSAPIQVNVRTLWLKGANFRVVGSAPAGALANVHLYVDGVSTGAAATMGVITGSNYAMFDFSANPVSLITGSHTLDVRADIVGGSSYTVQVSAQQASDIVLFDGQVGVNIAALGPAGAAYTANTAGNITINAGSASVNVDPTFQTMTTITGGSTNAVIGRFKVHGYGEDVKVTTLSVTPLIANGTVTGGACTTGSTGLASGTPCGLNNVTVFFNGSQVGSSQNIAFGSMGSATSFNLGSQMILPAGADSYIEVRADLQNTNSVNYITGSVSANLVLGSSNAQGQTSHTTLNFPGSTITGTTLTIQTGSFAVSKNASYLSQVLNSNVANAKLGSFTLQNQSSSEGVRITNLQVAVAFPAATTFVLAGSTTNVTTTQTWVLNQTAALAGITAGNVLTLAANAGCSTVPVITVASVSGSTLTSVATGQTASNVNTCTNGTAVVAVAPTSGPADITNISNLRTSETSGSGSTPVQPTASNNFSVDFTLMPGQSKNIDIIGDLGAANMGTVTMSLSTTAIGSSSNVTVLQNGSPGTAVGGQVITLGSGSLGLPAIVSSSTSTSQYVAAGSTTGVTDASRASYNIVASNGNATITELKFDNSGTSGGITSVRVGSTTASMVSNIAYLTGLSIPVANGGAGVQVDAYASYPPVGTTGIASTSTGVLRLCYIKYTIGGTTTTVGSAACGGPTTASYPVSSGATMTLVGSKPKVEVMTPSGAVLAAGAVEAIDVKITADSAGPIKVQSFSITTSFSANTSTTTTVSTGSGNPIIVKDANNNTIALTGTGCGSTAVNINCYFASTAGGLQVNLGSAYQINAGQSETFKIFVPVAAIGTGTNTTNSMFTALTDGSGAITSNNYFAWYDTAGSNTTVITGTANIFQFPSTTTVTVHN